MTTQITPQDWDALSAYLDNALNQRERQRLENQLQSRPDLRAALKELRQTRALLRSTPTLRVPRNFTLTPLMAGERAMRPRTYPIFRLAFTLASIFLLFSFAGELTLNRLAPGAAPAQDVALVESMAAEAPMAEAEDGQRLFEESAPMEPEMMEGPASEESMSEAQVYEEPGGGGGEEPIPGAEQSLQQADIPTLTPEAMTKKPPEAIEEAATPEMVPEAYPEPFAFDQGDAANSTGPALQEGVPESAAATAPESETPDFWASPWRVWQIIFGALAVLSGLVLIFMRRNR